MSGVKGHTRVNDILLGPLERSALRWLSAHMPVWVNPDHLTAVGICGALITFASYGLSNFNANFLWVADLGLVINWFGDSLDGTLARYRQIERPRYGFFVDHTIDALSEMLVVMGLGLSPYIRLEVASLALVGYLMMSVLVYVRTYVDDLFRISYGRFGPTEIRLIIILINTLFYFAGRPVLNLPYVQISLYDLVVTAIAAILMIIFIVSTLRQARELAQLKE